MLLVLAVFVSLGLVGGSAAEDARGAQGEAVNRLGPHDDYLGATIFRVADSVLVGGGVGLSRTSRDVVGDDGVAGRKKVVTFAAFGLILVGLFDWRYGRCCHEVLRRLVLPVVVSEAVVVVVFGVGLGTIWVVPVFVVFRSGSWLCHKLIGIRICSSRV